MGETTITVSESTLERFKSLKTTLDDKQKDVPDHTNESFLCALMDTWETAEDGYYSDPSADEIAEQLKAEIDNLAFDQVLFEDEAERIIGRIDDLENTLPKKTAEELR